MGFFSMGFGEMALVAVAAVVLFGGRLPEVARTVGGYYQQFRQGLNDIQNSIKNDLDAQDFQAQPKIGDHSDYDDTEDQDLDDDPAPLFYPPAEQD